jgi:hypothetical protein
MPVKDAIAFLDDLKQPLTVYRASNPRAAVMHNRANSPFLLAWCEPCQSSRPLILVDVRVRFTIIEQRVSGYVCSVAQDCWARLPVTQPIAIRPVYRQMRSRGQTTRRWPAIGLGKNTRQIRVVVRYSRLKMRGFSKAPVRLTKVALTLWSRW